jgi:DNA-binding transcriptional LysR family regulator
MDWDKLRIFHAVAKAGSFTSAGEKLNLSQSAISRQISQLEESIGVMLFHRHARGLLLTEQGEILQSAAEDIVRKLMLLEGKLSDTRQLPEGPLVITVSNFIGSTWLVPRLPKFVERYPDIQLTVLYDDRVLNLGMREADAALRLHKPTQSELIPRHLKKITFHICASDSYFEKHGKPQNKDDLKNHRLIGFPPAATSPIQNPNWLFDLAGVNPEKNNHLMMLNSMYAIFKAVEQGAGIAVLPDYLISANNALKVILPEYQRPAVDMYFVYSEERRNSERINALRDFLLETVSEPAL